MSSLNLEALLKKAIDKNASDLHLVTGKRPIYRIHGELMPEKDSSAFDHGHLKTIIFDILNQKQKERFQSTRELDFSYKCFEGYQFRVNVHMEKNSIAATVRITPSKILSAEELGLPQAVDSLISKHKGLVLLSGMAGSGKSTTMTYVIDKINSNHKCKIITIEDPIEYVHESKQSLIIQREVGSDTESFANALKYALRQDPDVVVVGEMRDPESISMALTTAETGHLVFTTVHAPDAVETLNRIIDAYDMSEREQLCAQLGGNLLAIIYQILVPRKDGKGRVLATEVMLGSMPIRNLIRRKDFVEIRGQMEAEADKGMHTLEMCLSELARKEIISEDTARAYAKYPNLLKLSKAKAFGEIPDKEIIISKQDQQATGKDNTQKQEGEPKDINILIVHSKEKDRQDMKASLKAKGYEFIQMAEKGNDGLELAKLIRPNIVILDTFLHDVDSFELCKKIKRLSPEISVIIITSKLEPTDSMNAQSAGADDFVIQTSTFDLLARSIRKINVESSNQLQT